MYTEAKLVSISLAEMNNRSARKHTSIYLMQEIRL